MPHVLARPQREPRRPTHRTARIEISELHPLLRQLINIRGGHHLLSETTQVPIAQIIAHDVNDVRLGRNTLRQNERGNKERQSKPSTKHTPIELNVAALFKRQARPRIHNHPQIRLPNSPAFLRIRVSKKTNDELFRFVLPQLEFLHIERVMIQMSKKMRRRPS